MVQWWISSVCRRNIYLMTTGGRQVCWLGGWGLGPSVGQHGSAWGACAISNMRHVR
jgi:hypothetical protein